MGTEGDYHKLLDARESKSVVLVSGGIDSTVALYLAKLSTDPVALEFSYAGRPAIEERRTHDICGRAGVELYKMNYPIIEGSSRISLPESNTIYYTLAAAFAKAIGAKYIVAGQIKNDWQGGERNAGPTHYAKLNDLIVSEYTDAPQIIAPLLHMDKREVCRLGTDLGAPLALTWSCPYSSDVACGVCVQCKEREDALKELLMPT